MAIDSKVGRSFAGNGCIGESGGMDAATNGKRKAKQRQRTRLTSSPEVSVVIVCMNQLQRLIACLDSLFAHNAAFPFEVWVVAYLFSRENLQALRKRYPQVNVIESNETRGFSENNNLALRRARGRYCFLLNDDTKMEMDVLARLAGSFERHPDAAAFMPKILNWDGGVQSCGDDELTVGRWFLREFGIMKWGNPHLSGDARGGVFPTRHVGGAAFMIRTDVLRELGYLDERYFFTPEDAALSARVNESGYRCYVDPDVEVFHECHTTLKAHLLPVMVAMQRGQRLFFSRDSAWRDFGVGGLMAFRDAMKLFCWCFRRGRAAREHRRMWGALLNTSFSRATPKELFVRYSGRPAGKA